MNLRVGLLVVSDRAFSLERPDESLPLLKRALEDAGWPLTHWNIVPDEIPAIQRVLRLWADVDTLDLILTTGGTGVSLRDVTPEATRPLMHKELPGVAELLRQEGRRHTPLAVLSRGVAGLRGKSFVVNLPGKPRAAGENLRLLLPLIPHVQALVNGATPTKTNSMLTPDEARNLIAAHSRLMPAQEVALDQAMDRVLAHDLLARADAPPFTNAAMDGFAVQWEDVAEASPQRPVELPVRGTVRAGEETLFTLAKGEAIKIMTGAPLPAGANAVVRVEDTHENGASRVFVKQRARPDQFIRRRSEDVGAGERLLSRGKRLRAYEVALLAAQGFDRVPVAQKPLLALVVTGDELLMPGETRRPGKIWDANGPALRAALSRRGNPLVYDTVVKDQPLKIQAALRRALRAADVVLLSGGVSLGDFDFTRDVLRSVNAKEVFWRVAIKPGGPLLFARGAGHQLIFGLPGNPLSALVCLEEFVWPALEIMEGVSPPVSTYDLEGLLINDFTKPPHKQQFLFCVAEGQAGRYLLRAVTPQGSALLRHASQANALAVVPLGVEHLKTGDNLRFRWLT